MTLAVGTTLQNGTYVVDAWVTDDAVGPVYLAMDVPQGQWVQLRVMGSRRPDLLPSAAYRQQVYARLAQVPALGHSIFPQRLQGFEEDGVCYQVSDIPPGLPLDRLVSAPDSIGPRRSIALIQQLREALEALRSVGGLAVHLTPDQVWYAPDSQAVTFTGFDLVQPDEGRTDALGTSGSETDDPGQEAGPALPPDPFLVRNLSHLLYFALTSRRAEATQAPLGVELRRCHPALPTRLDAALDLGHRATQATDGPPLSLADWVSQLPSLDQLPEHSPRPVAPRPRLDARADVQVAQPLTERSLPAPAPSTARRRGVALAFTGVVAIASGLGFGLYTRLQPASSASPERLNPNQSFPPLQDWTGNDLWQPWDDAPMPRRRPDYGTTPPANLPAATEVAPAVPEPAAPPPAVSAPEPELPASDPIDSWVAPAGDPPRSAPDPGQSGDAPPAPAPPLAPAPLAPPPLAPPLSPPEIPAPAPAPTSDGPTSS